MGTSWRPSGRLLAALTAALGCIVVVAVIGLATGYLQFRPRPAAASPQVYRDVTAEHLFGDHRPTFVYRFRGGLMKCWAQTSRTGKVETVGPVHCFTSFKDRPPVDRAEGYFALLGPTSSEDGFTLKASVTRYSSPDNRESVGAFHLLPARPKPGGESFEPPPELKGRLDDTFTSLAEPARGSAQRDPSQNGVEIPSGEWVGVQRGQDVLVLEYWAGAKTDEGKRAGGPLGVRLWVRFYTPDEVREVPPELRP
jgi:hypothetical protein